MRGEQPWLTNRARVLRSRPISAEAKLWAHLRNRQLGDHKFVRQMPIGPYFADFVCRERKVVVEVDGGTHSTDQEVTQDTKRTSDLRALGYRVSACTTTMFITTSTALSTRCWPSSRRAVDRPGPLAAPHPIPLPVALGIIVGTSVRVDGPRAAGRGRCARRPLPQNFASGPHADFSLSGGGDQRSSPPQFSSIFSAAINASWGISTWPNWRIFFLPFFCFSSSLRFLVMSPP